MRDEDEATVTEPTQVEVTEAPSTDQNATETENVDSATPTGAETPANTANTGEAAPAKSPEELAKEAAEAEAKANELFGVFEAAVAEAVEARDVSTGAVPEAQVSPVKVAYANLPNPATKKRARDFLDTRMKETLTKELNASKAKVYMDLGAAVKTTQAQRETVVAKPVDPTEAHVNNVAAFYLAVSLQPVGPNVSPDWTKRVQDLSRALAPEAKAWMEYEAAHKAWADKAGTDDEATRGEEPKEPEVGDILRHAIKIARGRSTGTARKPRTPRDPSAAGTASTGAPYTGPKRSIKTHIGQVFANVPVGTFIKTGVIAKTVTAEYPDGSASSGAVTSALGSAKFDVPGVVPASEGGIAGARKIA